MAEVILYTGGARSGKSSLALQRAEDIGTRKLFVATCPLIDGEMSDRVERHKRERSGRGWETIECERELASLFPTPAEQFQVVIIDCLTLWVNNLLYHAESASATINDDVVTAACGRWLAATDAYQGTLICVTNEVGLGIVPDNPLARRYRDLVGTCNQIIAAKAKEVVLVCCGVPLNIKKSS